MKQFLSLSRPVQILLLNSFTISLGFYMLYPYLAVYFRDDLGFPAWVVGLVLGIRVLSQQGMTVFGGILADALGLKPAILGGLALRAAGFGMFGFADTFELVLAAAILSGLGGALFSPAQRAYLAEESPAQRAEAFALSNVFGQAGTLLGPLVGLALLSLSFPVIAAVAGSLFAALTLLQVRYLPAQASGPAGSKPRLLEGWREVARNHVFLLFSLVMLGQFTLTNQLYLGLPLEIERLTGSQAPVSALFIVSSILTIGFQLSVTNFCKRRWRPSTTIGGGLILMGLAFLPPLLVAPFLPLDKGVDPPVLDALVPVLNLLPVMASAVILSFGLMATTPFSLELVPILGRERLTATYFGVFSMASGIGATAGNILTGIAFDSQESLGLTGLPWVFMTAIGIVSGLGMLAFARRPAYIAAAADADVHPGSRMPGR